MWLCVKIEAVQYYPKVFTEKKEKRLQSQNQYILWAVRKRSESKTAGLTDIKCRVVKYRRIHYRFFNSLVYRLSVGSYLRILGCR